MTDTYYAWSNFTNDEGKKFKPGAKVSASDLGVDDEEFQAFVDSGAVRTVEFPELPEGFTGSPREFRLQQLAVAASGEEYDVAKASLEGAGYAEPLPEESKEEKAATAEAAKKS